MDKYKLMYRRAAEARIFLNVHRFITESENEKIWKRIEKWREEMNIADPKKKIPR